MRRLLIGLVSWALLTVEGRAETADSNLMPETLVFSGETYPGWVAAQRILTPEGQLDTSLFRPALAEQIPALLSLPERDGCLRLGSVIIDYLDPLVRTNIAQAAGTADVVLIGRVTGLAPGIRELEAGTLIRIEPVEILKAKAPLPPGEQVLFVPVGDFTIGGKRICKTDTRYVSLPTLGDELLLFVTSTAKANADVVFLHTREAGGIVLLRGDSFELPEEYRSDLLVKGMNRQDLVAFVRKVAKGVERLECGPPW